MAVREVAIFSAIFAAMLEVGDLIFRNVPCAFVLFLERRNNRNDLRYDDCAFDCEGSGEAGDVGDQRCVSPDSTPVLIHAHSLLLKT